MVDTTRKVLLFATMTAVLASAPTMAAKPPDAGKGGSAGEIEELLERVDALEVENGLQGGDIDNLKSDSAGQALQIAALGARMDNAEIGLGDLGTSIATQQGSIDDLLADVGLLQSDLAAQQATINRQQNVITSLRNVLRSNRKLVKAQTARARLGRSAEAALDLKNRVHREEGDTGVPLEMTYLTYREWVQQARDVGETTRCMVVGMDKLPGDDCQTTDGAEIPEDSVVLSGQDYVEADYVQIVTLDLVIEPFIDELQTRVDALPNGGNGTPCMVWNNTKGILAEYVCLYYLDKVEARNAVEQYSEMMDTMEEATTVILGGDEVIVEVELDCEVNALNVTAGEPALTCEQESASDLLDAWDTISIKGEKRVRDNTSCSMFYALFTGCNDYPGA